MFNAINQLIRQYSADIYLKIGAAGLILGLGIGSSMALLLPHKSTAIAIIRIGHLARPNPNLLVEDPALVVLRLQSRSFLKEVLIPINQLDILDLLDPMDGNELTVYNPKGTDAVVLRVSDADRERSLLLVSAVANGLVKRHMDLINTIQSANGNSLPDWLKPTPDSNDSTKVVVDKAIADSEIARLISLEVQKLLIFAKHLDEDPRPTVMYNTKLVEEPYIETYSLLQRVIRFSIISGLLGGLLALGGGGDHLPRVEALS